MTLSLHGFLPLLLSFLILVSPAHAAPCPEVVSRQFILAGQETIDDELLKFSAVISDNTGTCTATVLNNRYILTAAHCDYFPGASVRVGVSSSLQRPSGKVKRFIKHPKYTGKSIIHDIAVVEIDPPIPAPTVVRLHIGATVKAGLYVRAAGYGVNTPDYRTVSASATGMGRFRRVDLPIVSIAQCKKTLEKNNIRLPPEFSATNYVCAGFITPGHCGGDTCVGDSGGPIVVKRVVDKKYVQVGLTSAGSGCGEQNIPGLYTNIESHVAWVKSIAGDDLETVDAFEDAKPPPPPPAPAPSPKGKPPALPSPSSIPIVPSPIPSKSARPAAKEPTIPNPPTSPAVPKASSTSAPAASIASSSAATNPPKINPSASANTAAGDKTESAKEPSSTPTSPSRDATSAKESVSASPAPSGSGTPNGSSKPEENGTPSDAATATAPNGDGAAISGSQTRPDSASEPADAPSTDKAASVKARSGRKLSGGAIGAIVVVLAIVAVTVIGLGIFFRIRASRASSGAAAAAPEPVAAAPAAANV